MDVLDRLNELYVIVLFSLIAYIGFGFKPDK